MNPRSCITRRKSDFGSNASVKLGFPPSSSACALGKREAKRNRSPVDDVCVVGSRGPEAFTYTGAAEPLSIVALAVLLWLSPRFTMAFWLLALALAAGVLTHLLYWVLVAPVNKVWLEGEALSAPARQLFGATGYAGRTDWTSLRDRWEWSHVYRAASSVTASCFFLQRRSAPLARADTSKDTPISAGRVGRRLRRARPPRGAPVMSTGGASSGLPAPIATASGLSRRS